MCGTGTRHREPRSQRCPRGSTSLDGTGRAPQDEGGLDPRWRRNQDRDSDGTGFPLPRYRSATGFSVCPDRDGLPGTDPGQVPAVPRPGPHRDEVPAVCLSRYRSGTGSSPSVCSSTGRYELPAASITPLSPWSRSPRPAPSVPPCPRSGGAARPGGPGDPGLGSLPPAGLSPGTPNPPPRLKRFLSQSWRGTAGRAGQRAPSRGCLGQDPSGPLSRSSKPAAPRGRDTQSTVLGEGKLRHGLGRHHWEQDAAAWGFGDWGQQPPAPTAEW